MRTSLSVNLHKTYEVIIQFQTNSGSGRFVLNKRSDLWAIGEKKRGLLQIVERRAEGLCFSSWAIPNTKIKAYKTVGTSCITLLVHFQLVMHCLYSFSSRALFNASAKQKLCSVFVVRFQTKQILAFTLMCKVLVKILNRFYSNL